MARGAGPGEFLKGVMIIVVPHFKRVGIHDSVKEKHGVREKGANDQKDLGQTARSGDGWRGRTKAIVAPMWS